VRSASIAGFGLIWLEPGQSPDQQLYPRFVNIKYKDFVWGDAASWEEVPWIAKRLEKPQSEKDEDDESQEKGFVASNKPDNDGDRDENWEIWDKKSRTIIKLIEGEVAETIEDVYGLEGFYPCPRPVMYNIGIADLIPQTDFFFYKNLLDEYEENHSKIKKLTASLKLAGLYSSVMQSAGGEVVDTKTPFENMLTGEDGAMHQVPIVGVGALADYIYMHDNRPTIEMLKVMEEEQQLLKAKIDEASGISDILRGFSDPKETATAQQIKNNTTNVRLRDRQNEIQRVDKRAIAVKTLISYQCFLDEA